MPDRRRRVAALPVAMLLAACGAGGGEEPGAGPSPSPTDTGRWHGLSATCPVLDGAAARTFGITGEGRPTPDYKVLHAASRNSLIADCVWGRTDGTAPGVTARVSITYRQAVDAAWDVISVYEAVPGLGDDARKHDMYFPPSLVIDVRVDNVWASVRVLPVQPVGGTRSTSAQRSKELERTAVAITRDVLDDLR